MSSSYAVTYPKYKHAAFKKGVERFCDHVSRVACVNAGSGTMLAHLSIGVFDSVKLRRALGSQWKETQWTALPSEEFGVAFNGREVIYGQADLERKRGARSWSYFSQTDSESSGSCESAPSCESDEADAFADACLGLATSMVDLRMAEVPIDTVSDRAPKRTRVEAVCTGRPGPDGRLLVLRLRGG